MVIGTGCLLRSLSQHHLAQVMLSSKSLLRLLFTLNGLIVISDTFSRLHILTGAVTFWWAIRSIPRAQGEIREKPRRRQPDLCIYRFMAMKCQRYVKTAHYDKFHQNNICKKKYNLHKCHTVLVAAVVDCKWVLS